MTEKILAISFPPMREAPNPSGNVRRPVKVKAFYRFGRSRQGYVRHRVRSVSINQLAGYAPHWTAHWLCGNMGRGGQMWSEDTLGPCCLRVCDRCELVAKSFAEKGYREITA